jgi:glutathione S-transferase
MSRLTLYVDHIYLSPYAMSAFVALKEMGLEFDIQTLDIEGGEQHRSPFRERSGTGRIPTLVHEDFWLSESSAICEYLHDQFGASGVPLYPAGHRERARARQVQAWLRSDLLPLRQDRSTEIVFLGATRDTPLSDEARRAADKLFRFAGTLVGRDGGPMFGQWSIADVELAMTLSRLVLNGDEVPDKLARYARAQWARPAVQSWCKRARAAAGSAET